jgi:hypothetical protein
MTEIFEQNQADLEFATENLSELCEKPVEIIQEQNLKQVILDKAVYVKQRQLVLLEDTAKGLAEGRWEFNVHAKGWMRLTRPRIRCWRNTVLYSAFGHLLCRWKRAVFALAYCYS